MNKKPLPTFENHISIESRTSKENLRYFHALPSSNIEEISSVKTNSAKERSRAHPPFYWLFCFLESEEPSYQTAKAETE